QDRDGLRQWLRNRHDKAFVPAFCSFYPADRILQRDLIIPRRLFEPGYITDFARDKFGLSDPTQWHVHVIDPLAGEPIEAEGAQRPALFSALPHESVREVQQFLLDVNLMPYRLEVGTLPLIASLFHFNESRRDTRAG